MRCSSCNKFVPYDTEVDVEVDSEEVSEDGSQLTFTARRVLNCAECGDELKEATFEFEVEVIADPPDCISEDGHDWDLEVNATPTDRLETKDRKGKPIKNRRYMTQYYGVDAEYTVKCKTCNVEYTGQTSDEVSASSMDELQ